MKLSETTFRNSSCDTWSYPRRPPTVSVLVLVELVDHRLQLFVADVLPDFLADPPQTAQPDFPARVFAHEQAERPQRLFLGVAAGVLPRHWR